MNMPDSSAVERRTVNSLVAGSIPAQAANSLKVHFSSKVHEWETPQALFDKLNQEFNFDIDLCATENNKKCKTYLPNMLDISEKFMNMACFMNPPYGRGLSNFIHHAYGISQYNLVVALLPARTDTKWWSIFWDHDNHRPRPGIEVRFIKGRLRFELEGKPIFDKKGRAISAPFPSAIVIMDRRNINNEK